MTNDSETHLREYGGLLEIPEKAALLWLARRTPQWINSDHLTLLGLVSMLAAGASYRLAGQYPPALFIIVASLGLNWLGDSLDGTLARFRNCQRPRYGYYVDHVIDLFGVTALLAGLACSGYMNRLIAVALLAAFAPDILCPIDNSRPTLPDPRCDVVMAQLPADENIARRAVE